MNYFFALELSAEARQIVAEQVAAWRCVLPKNLSPCWYEAEDYHITLKFLGDLSSPADDELLLKGMVIAERCSLFTIALSGMGAFPDLAKPRILWVGVKDNPSLTALALAINGEVASSGFSEERFSYVPHITVAHCTPHPNPSYVHIPHARERMYASYTIDHFVLMQTLPPESRAKDSKARYNIVRTFPFGRQPEAQGEIIG